MAKKKAIKTPEISNQKTDIQLVWIKLIKFIIDCDDNIPNVINPDYEFLIQSRFGTNLEKEHLLFDMVIELSQKEFDGDLTGVRGKFQLQTAIKVQELVKFITEVEDPDTNIKTLNVQQELAITVASISYSTFRGVLLTRTEGTILGPVLLPLIDPKSLVAIK